MDDRPDKTHPRIRGVAPVVAQAARQNRAALTPAEQTLWAALRRKQLDGLRFRCQYPVGRFILDFYCPSHKLVIELDGASHDGREEIDADRTVILESYGYTVLRFPNAHVLTNLPSVLQAIKETAERIKPSTTNPSQHNDDAD